MLAAVPTTAMTAAVTAAPSLRLGWRRGVLYWGGHRKV
jgi:hypothetical protein